MSISTYAELATAISGWLHRSDLTLNVPDFILGADDRINREVVEVRERETALSSTISASGTLSLPSDYNQLKHAYISQASVQWLDRKSPEWIYTNYPSRSADRLPHFIAREGTSFIFGPFPDSEYLVSGIYYKDLDPLSTSTNALFLASPLLWLYAALVEAEPFIKNDKRIPVWEAKYMQIKRRVEEDTDGENHAGSNLRMVAG